MKQVETKKAMEIAEELEREYGKKVVIYHGTPDARFKEQYFAVQKVLDGRQACGMYGLAIRTSKTLKGLLVDEHLVPFNI